MARNLFLTLLLLLTLSGCAKTAPEPATAAPSTLSTTAPATLQTLPPETTAPREVPQETHPPLTTDFVSVTDALPGCYVDPKYATADNFTGEPIYVFSQLYLRQGTAEKLAAVMEELEPMGLTLLVWDAFRPVSAQFRLWEVCPDPTFVADPNRTFSSHSRGNTVDLTLCDPQGLPVEMPTAFDDFSPLADRDYSDCTPAAAQNALLLQNVMEKHGFTGYSKEWWHFSDTDSYDVEEVFDPAMVSQWYAAGAETIPLTAAPDPGAEVLARIPQWDTVTLLGDAHGYAMVRYLGRTGYIPTEALHTIEPAN